MSRDEQADAERRLTRLATPRLLRDPSAFEQIASRLHAWTPNASTSQHRLHEAPSAHESEQNRQHASQDTLVEPVQDNTSGRDDSASLVTRRDQPPPSLLATDSSRPTASGNVTWSAWDTIELDDYTTRRVLLIARRPSSFSIWECTALETWSEILSLHSLDKVCARDVATLGSVTSAAILPRPVGQHDDKWTDARPLVALACNSSQLGSHVALYSLRQHQIVHAFAVSGSVVRLAASKKHIAVSTTNPTAMHLHNASDFAPIACSPLSNVAAHPNTGAPVFDLGSGGRLLAYATSTPVRAPQSFDDDVAKPGTGIIANSGMFEVDTLSSTATLGDRKLDTGLDRTESCLGHDVARIVGGGVKVGVRAIGDLGSYWMSRAHAAGNASTTDVDTEFERNVSKSAPLPSVSRRDRRQSVDSRVPSGETSSKPAVWDGVVAVVDLCKSNIDPDRTSHTKRRATKAQPKLVAHFRASWSAVTFLSFSPSASMLLTATTTSQAFDVFELRPTASPQPKTTVEPVWHRFRLNRGLSHAKTVSAAWSSDGRFVSVGTNRGTLHVFPVHPAGGKLDLDQHFGSKVVNPTELPGLSSTVSTVARIRPTKRLDLVATDFPPPPTAFVPPHETLTSTVDGLRPVITTQSPLKAKSGSRQSSSAGRDAPCHFQDLLVFQPQESTTLLARISIAPIPTSVTEGALDAASKGDVGRIASTAVSGLTQLMKTRGLASGATVTSKTEWSTSYSAKASWTISADARGEDAREPLETLASSSNQAALAIPSQHSAQAEIETSSKSPRVLPRSVYSSRQFSFYTMPDEQGKQKASGKYRDVKLDLVEVRCEVQARQSRHAGDAVPDHDATPNSAIGATLFDGPSSFDAPIKSAMQTVLDQASSLGSRVQPAGFPNGVAGKSSGPRWRDALPIRASNVNAGLSQGMSTMRRVGSKAIAVAGATAAHVQQRSGVLGGGAGGGARLSAASVADTTSSLSFEEDAVFADRMLEEGCTDSTAGTSARSSYADEHEGVQHKQGAQDVYEDEPWGRLEDEAIDNGLMTDMAEKMSIASPAVAAHEALPFDDDFDDLELALDRQSPTQTSLTPVVPPLPVVVADLEGQPTDAPPPATLHSVPLGVEPSPVKVPPLLIAAQGLKATVLSSSPSSVGSMSSMRSNNSQKKKKRK
ncbi:hypothetical protein ACM66B_003857 [Microbotryomycetes sp. NB124-2]